MKWKKRKKRKRLFLMAVLMVVVFSGGKVCAAGTKAAEEVVTLKVPFYQLEGFFEYDEKGEVCGYGVDYLNELSKYAPIKWEYVPVDSWEKIGPLLQTGEVDINLPVSEPAKPSEIYSYTTDDILMSYHAILTLKSREDLYFEDYEVLAQMKIAATKNLLEKTGISDYLKALGALEHIVYYEDYNQCEQALRAGEVDALVTNIMDLTEDMKILDKFAVTRNYIITVQNSPHYTMLNTAITELKLNEPSFQSDLYKAYYPDRAVTPYTKEETVFMNRTEALTVATYADREPVSYFDTATNRFEGIAIDVMDRISKEIGITFNYVPVTTEHALDMLDQVDLVMPISQYTSEQDSFRTSSLFELGVKMVVPGGSQYPTGKDRVGVLSSTEGIIEMLKTQTDFEVVYFEDNDSGFKALQAGKIEAFAGSFYVLNYLLENPRYSDLSLLHYQTIPLDYSISGKTNDILQSVLEKGINHLSEDEVNGIITEKTAFKMESLSLADRTYIYRKELLFGGGILVLLIGLYLYHNSTRTKYIKQIEAKGKEQEEANRAKSDFLSRMSHDIRTPMNAILGMEMLAEDVAGNPAETKEYLREIQASGRYMLGLINDVLDMSRIESGHVQLKLEPVDIGELSASILAIMKPLAEKKKITLAFSCVGAENVPMLMIDRLRTQQIILNLLNNAVKFTPEGGKIDFLVENQFIEKGRLRSKITIADNGIGMSREFLKHLYEPFSQEQNTLDVAGTGLGLAIVKNLVELSGGTIEVESTLGKGSEFKITLIASLAEVKTTKKVLLEKAEANMKGKRILLVEDHLINAKIATKMLEKKGLLVELASNGQQSIDKIESAAEGYFDAVLMDLRMPVMDGLTAAKKIRELPRKDVKTLPIIAMTANAYDDDRKNCFDAGMNDHLSKPIDPELLYHTLAQYIG